MASARIFWILADRQKPHSRGHPRSRPGRLLTARLTIAICGKGWLGHPITGRQAECRERACRPQSGPNSLDDYTERMAPPRARPWTHNQPALLDVLSSTPELFSPL